MSRSREFRYAIPAGAVHCARSSRLWIWTAAVALLGLPVAGGAASFTVDSTLDTTDAVPGDGACDDGTGVCTLRAAVMETNALALADSIVLPAGTYLLSIAGTGEDAAATGDLDITDSLAILGAGVATTIIDGAGLDSVFHVDPLQTGPSVSMDDITIQNGARPGASIGGGGIAKKGGSLALTDCAVKDNSAYYGGGIYNLDGILTITRCEISGNTATTGVGGGIVHTNQSGDLTVSFSTLTNNAAGSQGGSALYSNGSATIEDSSITANHPTSGNSSTILNYGTLMMYRTSVSSNLANFGTGGIENRGSATIIDSTINANQGAEGIENNSSATITLTNSTVSGNTCPSIYCGTGIRNKSGATLNLRNATVAFNQGPTGPGTPAAGGITNDGTVNMRNTILSNNTSSTGQPDCLGTLTSEGYNLVRSLAGCTIVGDTTGNVTGQDPRLGSLQDNGGPTYTHALRTKSPAIDAGNPAVPGSGGLACEATDQRAVARPIDGDGDGTLFCDTGAYETSHQAFTLTVNSSDDTDDGTCDVPHCSLREAIDASNATSTGVDTIAFDIPGAGPHTIQPLSPLPNVSDPVVIDGYTQAGASPNSNGPWVGSNAILMIEIDGTSAGTGISGLKITAGETTVRGLVINRFVRSGATGGAGIELSGWSNNIVEGNFVGTDPTGTIDRGNESTGVTAQGSNNLIGGLTPAARNVISGNGSNGGLMIWGSGNVVQGNFIGTDATGTAPLPNGQGVNVVWGSANLIGGGTAEAANLISGNGHGVQVSAVAGTVIQGNRIGTDLTGTSSVGNGHGLWIKQNASNTLVGGSAAGQGNLISGNGGKGIFLSTAPGTLVHGNLIGTAVDGIGSLPNQEEGIYVYNSSGAEIGGAAPGAGNVIAFNGPRQWSSRSGVVIYSGTGVNIQSNRIFSNVLLGIDLGLDGLTVNDAGDGDSGANNLQNFPVLTSVGAGGATIAGDLNSTASTEFRLEFFSSTACDASGNGEGETFLGADTATTDATGNVAFVSTPAAPVPPGQFVTATATDPGGNTSEFSACLEYAPGFVDLSLAKDDGGVSTTPGSSVSYALTYANSGTLVATGVVLTDTVPANSSFNAAGSTPGWACVPDAGAGSVCTLAIGAVAAGGGSSATFAVTVDDPVPSGVTQISNTASVADDGANGSDPTPGDNTNGDTTPVDAAPDLAVSKDDGGATATPGGTVSYTLTYANNGDQDATGVVLTDTVPANSSFNAASSTPGWACVPDASAGSVCTLAIGAVAAGGGSSATFAVTVDDPVSSGVAEISNTASVADDGANGADPTPGDNSNGDTTPVDAAPDLAVSKDDGGATATPGGTVSYTLTYANNGDQDATGVELSETVPDNTSFNSATSTPGWACLPDDAAGSICTLVLGALAAGGGSSSVFAVDVDDPVGSGVDEISNTASIADDGANGPDPIPGNNTDGDTTPVEALPDLSIDKEDEGTVPAPGETVEYTLTYLNSGSQDATGVVLTDMVPDGSSFNASASSAGWACVPDGLPGSVCTLDLGDLGSGAGGAKSFAVDLDDPLPPGMTELSNTASIADDGANGTDPTPGDNEDTVVTSLDGIPPTVTGVNSEGDTGDGSLDPCETARVLVSSLLVTFSEAMFDPPEDTDPGDVTNPDNYLLVSAGPDADISTLSCGAIAGDDVAVGIFGVTYDESMDTATLALAGGLAASPYRLFACGSTTLRDEAGNALDGDGDGAGGDDFSLTFRADPYNILGNGSFDCGLGDWTIVESIPGAVTHSVEDVDDSLISGCVEIFNPAPTGSLESFSLAQCLPLVGSSGYELKTWVEVAAPGGVNLRMLSTCDFFDQAGCLGADLGQGGSVVRLEDTAEAWWIVGSGISSPVGTMSGLCAFTIVSSTGDAFEANVDGAFLKREPVIFEDGFESGDASAWSTVEP